MGAYLTRRALELIPMLVAISAIVFGILHMIPGGPLAVYLENPYITPEQIERLRQQLGLDQPLPVQYGLWLKAFALGDWGYSFVSRRPAVEVVLERVPATVQLMGAAFVLAGLVALPLGVLSALRQYSKLDYIATASAFFGISMPVFWFGLMLQLMFAVWLGWLPSAGMIEIGDGSLIDRLRHLVLPATVLSLLYAARWTRYVRAAMLEVINQDYIRVARAKGLYERSVISNHALRNALIPVITVMAVDMAALFSGAVVTEKVFAWPGMGQLFVDSVLKVDYTVLMGILMVGSAAVLVLNLVADVLYAALDPRIRYE
jgi:peptide/nickel transport system permease protein